MMVKRHRRSWRGNEAEHLEKGGQVTVRIVPVKERL